MDVTYPGQYDKNSIEVESGAFKLRRDFIIESVNADIDEGYVQV